MPPSPAALAAALPELAGAELAGAVRQARALANLTRDQAAPWLSLSPVHLARIERGTAPARAVHLHVLLLVAGFVVAPGWDGWRFHDGALYAPTEPRRGFTPHHLYAARWAFEQVRHARALARQPSARSSDVVTSPAGDVTTSDGAP